MAEPPDLDALSRRYLDLWQGQLSALSGDRHLTETLARLLASTNAQVAAVFDATRRGHADKSGNDQSGSDTPAAADRTATTAAAPVDGAAELVELRARLVALEARVAELERPRPKRVRKPAAKPARD